MKSGRIFSPLPVGKTESQTSVTSGPWSPKKMHRTWLWNDLFLVSVI